MWHVLIDVCRNLARKLVMNVGIIFILMTFSPITIIFIVRIAFTIFLLIVQIVEKLSIRMTRHILIVRYIVVIAGIKNILLR
jgi:hypothetical protein